MKMAILHNVLHSPGWGHTFVACAIIRVLVINSKLISFVCPQGNTASVECFFS